MLKVSPPSFLLPGNVLLKGIDEPDYHLLIMHLNQMLTQLDKGLENQEEIDFFFQLALDFLVSFEKRKPKDIEVEVLTEHEYRMGFPHGTVIYLNIQGPQDRERMLNSRSIEKVSFYETCIQSLHSLQKYRNKEPIKQEASSFIISNLYEWYVFSQKHLFQVFKGEEELLQYFWGWEVGKPGFRSSESLYRIIDRTLASKELPCTYFNLYGIKEGLSKSWESIQERLIPIGLFLTQTLGKWHTTSSGESLLQKELAYLLGLEKVYKRERSFYRCIPSPEGKNTSHKLDKRRIKELYLHRAIVEQFLEDDNAMWLEKNKFWEKEHRKFPESEPKLPYPGGLLETSASRPLPFHSYVEKLLASLSFQKHVMLGIHKSGNLSVFPGTWSVIWTDLIRENPNTYQIDPVDLGKTIQQELRELVRKVFETRLKQKFSSWEDLKKTVLELPKAQRQEVLHSLKMCDPSAGTGQFLEAVLHELVIIFANLNCLSLNAEEALDGLQLLRTDIGLYPVNSQGIPIAYPSSHQGTSQSSEERKIHEVLFRTKLEIINKCLFGIAPSRFHVQVIKNRFLLSLLSNHYQYSGKQNFKWISLQGLRPNIYVGNALLSAIPLQAYAQNTSEENLTPADPRKDRLLALKAQYQKTQKPLSLWDMPKEEASPTDEAPTKEQLLLEEISDLERQLDDPEDFWKLYVNWKTLFPFLWTGKGTFQGFDWVGSAPPSQRQENFKSFNSYLRDRHAAYDSQNNYTNYLMELGVRLLRPGGQFLFLCPEKVFQAQYASPFRLWLKENTLYHTKKLRVEFEEIEKYKDLLALSGGKNMPVDKIGD